MTHGEPMWSLLDFFPEKLEIQILERLHSTGDVANNVVVRTLGGEVGNIGMKVSGTPQFTLGEEVIVFLRNDPVDPTQFQVIGMSQGKFHVERPEKGGAVAIPSLEGLAFAKPGYLGSDFASFMNAPSATGSDGASTIGPLAPGSYEVTVSSGGKSQSQPVNVTEGGEAVVSVVLP